jgi:hypothetical protein
MNSNALDDPFGFLSRRARRRWRQAERRGVRAHQAQQLTTLRSLAAARGALTSLLYPNVGGHAVAAEFLIAGKRIRVGQAHRLTLSTLAEALGSVPAVPLVAAGRYGPYWVLTFEPPTAPLTVLADKLFILPDRHNSFACQPPPLNAALSQEPGRFCNQ